MYFYGLNGKKIELIEADNEPISGLLGDALRPGDVNEQAHDIIRLARATRTFFGSPVNEGTLRKAGPRRPPSIYRDGQTKLLRCFYRELVVRFRPHVSEQKRRDYLGRFGLQIVRGNPFVLDQIVVRDSNDAKRGNDLIDVANALAELDDDIVLAVPNFVSQFKRAVPAIPAEQWHLDNTGQVPGQMPGEDVRAKQGWGIATGNPAIIVAVLDDGVDIEHPALKNQIWRNPDVASPDQYGRDFFLDPTDAGYFDPRPKVFRAPFNEMSGNDIHGTPCAALVVANASDARAFGVAVNCRILPVKIFHADAFASDEKVSNAFQHAASIADILSCSWVSPETPLIERAMEDATSKGRNGKGCAVFCAAGNDGQSIVGFPARSRYAVAVGASTDEGNHASYSNFGPELALVAPSSGGVRSVFTCDVSLLNRGFNLGACADGGVDGLYTNSFGGTSAATPIAAGVAAVVLSQQPGLRVDELKDLLKRTATRMGAVDSNGHSDLFGFGRVNLFAALK